MRKTLGGILVISLLTFSPTVYSAFHGTAFNQDLAMWRALKDYTASKATIVLVDKKGNETKEILEGEIDYLLAEIDNNSYKLTALLKERKNLAEQIENVMKQKSEAKVRLSNQQMEAYQGYADVSYRKNIDVLSCLHRIEDSKNLNDAEKELLHPYTDYSVIYSDIEQLREAQLEAIDKLSDVVAVSGHVLNVL